MAYRTLFLAALATLYALPISAFGGNDEKLSAAALIRSAKEATNIEGATPFRLSAQVALTFKTRVEGTYVFYWVSAQKWREEIAYPGYREITVRNGDKKWISRSLDFRPARVLQLRGLIGVVPKLADHRKEKIGRVKQRTVDQRALACVSVEREPNYGRTSESCFDPNSGLLLLRSSDSEYGKTQYEFSEHIPFAGKQFPGTLRIIEGDQEVVQAKIDSLTEETPANSMFAGLPDVEPWLTCDEIRPPKTVTSPDPKYDEESRRNHLQGTVELDVLVGKDGEVHRATVSRKLAPALDQAATVAVKSWHFKPAMCGDVAVPMEISVEVNFRTSP